MTETTDRIDLHNPVFDICHRLGLEPNNVAELKIRPRDVTATVYKRNDKGAKYTEPGPEVLPPVYDPDSDASGFTSVPATEIHEFEVTTHKIEATDGQSPIEMQRQLLDDLGHPE